MQNRAARMLLFIVDPITATQNGVRPPQWPPGKSKSRAPIVFVTEPESASALRLIRIPRIDYLVSCRVKGGPMVAQFFPWLEIVVANSQVESQIGADLVIILEVASQPKLVGPPVQGCYAYRGRGQVTQHEIQQPITGVCPAGRTAKGKGASRIQGFDKNVIASHHRAAHFQ